jgi:hypothetical protein
MYTAEIRVFACTSVELHNVTRQVNYIMILYYKKLDASFNETQLTI